MLAVFVGLGPMTQWSDGGNRVAFASPDCVNGASGLAAYYFDVANNKGTLNLSNGQPWVITLTDIDGSLVTGNRVYHLLIQDHGTGSGWETLPTQTHHDFYGAGGHLLQSDDNGWTVRSSHGFNPGDVPGTYDLRVVMSQRADDKWDISPYFRLPGGDWTLFYDGSWVTAAAFDLTKTRVAVGIDAGGGGTLCFTAPTADGVDLSNVYVDDDWAGTDPNVEVESGKFFGLNAFAAIQDGIDAVTTGGTVDVYPGTYNQDEANDRDPDTGGAGSSDFNIFVNKALTIQGVDDSGAPITDYDDVAAYVSPKRNTGGGHTDTIFVQADDVTITGLDVTGWTDEGYENNKTLESIGDNLTVKYNQLHGMDGAAALYMYDPHFDPDTDTSHVQSYLVEANLLDGG